MKHFKPHILSKAILIIFMLMVFNVGCRVNLSGQYTFQPPMDMNDGLNTGSLNDVGVDQKYLTNLVEKMHGGRYPEVHSILIYKDNKLVFEEYFRGHDYQWDAPYHHGKLVTWDRNMPHDIMSASKSIVSACIGVAIEHGFIESERQSVFDYLPEHQHLKAGRKADITIEHLLTMTAGLEWREWSAPYSSVENPCIGIWFQEKDPISYILEKPLLHPPGTRFNYSTGNMHVLGEVIRHATQMPYDSFAIRYIFEPLGVDTTNFYLSFPNGVVEVNSLRITPRAMIKFGIAYLNRGTWNGRRIIPEQWVEKSAHPYPGNNGINVPGEPSGKLGYSYTWWTKDYIRSGQKIHMYAASGFGGQHIMVLPEVHTIVVFTGGNFLSKRPPFKILREYILPALS